MAGSNLGTTLTAGAVNLFPAATSTSATGTLAAGYLQPIDATGGAATWTLALYSSAATPALLAQTADQLTAGWAAGTAKTLALTAPQTIATTGVYYAAIMMAATTPVSLLGRSVSTVVSAGVLGGEKIFAQTSGSALTGTAPATVATPTTVGTWSYAVAN